LEENNECSNCYKGDTCDAFCMRFPNSYKRDRKL
jgi:hypothetical protein